MIGRKVSRKKEVDPWKVNLRGKLQSRKLADDKRFALATMMARYLAPMVNELHRNAISFFEFSASRARNLGSRKDSRKICIRVGWSKPVEFFHPIFFVI